MELKDIEKKKFDTLARRLKKGDRKAATELYDDLAPKVYGFIYSRTSRREVAEDLSQDIFMKLIDKIETFDETKGSFLVWFWQIARNTLVDHYREKKETPFSSFEESDVEAMAVIEAHDADASLARKKLQTVASTFSKDEYELFEMRFLADMSYKDIAVILGKSEGALRVATLRLKEKIHKAFQS